MKRFDVEQYPLLKQLARRRGACLEDVLHYEEKPPYDFQAAIEADPLDFKKNKQILDEWGAFLNRHKKWLNTPSQVVCSLSSQDSWAELEKAVPEATRYIEAILSTPRPKVYYLAGSTQQAVFKHGPALLDKVPSVAPDMPTETGILLVEIDDDGQTRHCYIAYHIDSQGMAGILFIHDWMDGKAGLVLASDAFISRFTGDDVLGKHTHPDTQKFVPYALASLVFIHFFETETLEISGTPNDTRYRKATVAGHEYATNLNYPVHVVDASWFTTVIRTDPFLVKGHFRRQPYGPGRSQYKMRWIAAFQKKGYTRRAKREQTNDQTNP